MLKVLMMMTMSLMAVMSLTPVAEKLARLDWVRTTVPAKSLGLEQLQSVSCYKESKSKKEPKNN